MDQDSTALVEISEKRQAEFTAAAAEIDKIWGQLTAFAEVQKTTASVERDKANQISVGRDRARHRDRHLRRRRAWC